MTNSSSSVLERLILRSRATPPSDSGRPPPLVPTFDVDEDVEADCLVSDSVTCPGSPGARRDEEVASAPAGVGAGSVATSGAGAGDNTCAEGTSLEILARAALSACSTSALTGTDISLRVLSISSRASIDSFVTSAEVKPVV